MRLSEISLLLLVLVLPTLSLAKEGEYKQNKNNGIKQDRFCKILSKNYAKYSEARKKKQDLQVAVHFAKKSQRALSCQEIELEPALDCIDFQHKDCPSVTSRTEEARTVKKIIHDHFSVEEIRKAEPRLVADLYSLYDCWVSEQSKFTSFRFPPECRKKFYSKALKLAQKIDQTIPYLIAESSHDVRVQSVIPFANASASVSPLAKTLMSSAVEAGLNEETHLVLIGHAYEDMEENCNSEIAEARIKEVTKYLVDQGINKERIMSSSMGCAIPITHRPNELSKNRRLVMYVIQNEQ